MTSCSMEKPCVLILDLALDATAAKCCIFLRRRDLVADFERGAKAGIAEGERPEDFLLCPSSQMLVSKNLERLSEEDETGIGVFHTCAGGCFDGELQKGTKKCGRGGRSLIEGHVARQAGGMGEEMTKGDAPRVFNGWASDDKAWEQIAKGSFEIELAALMQEHSGRSGRDDLRNAGDVEDRVGGNWASSIVEGKVAESILKHDGAGSEDAKRATRKGLGRDRILENGEYRGEVRIGSRVEIAGGVFSGLHRFPA